MAESKQEAMELRAQVARLSRQLTRAHMRVKVSLLDPTPRSLPVHRQQCGFTAVREGSIACGWSRSGRCTHGVQFACSVVYRSGASSHLSFAKQGSYLILGLQDKDLKMVQKDNLISVLQWQLQTGAPPPSPSGAVETPPTNVTIGGSLDAVSSGCSGSLIGLQPSGGDELSTGPVVALAQHRFGLKVRCDHAVLAP